MESQIYEDNDIKPFIKEEIDSSGLHSIDSFQPQEDPLGLDIDVKKVKTENEVVSDEEVPVLEAEILDKKVDQINIEKITASTTSEIFECKSENVWIKNDSYLDNQEFNEGSTDNNDVSQLDLNFELEEKYNNSFDEKSIYSNSNADTTTAIKPFDSFRVSSPSSALKEENLISQLCNQNSSSDNDISVYGEQNRCVCYECEVSFNTFKDFDKHVLDNISEALYICDHCKNQFTSGCKLKIHCQDHFEKKEYSCDLCEESFSTSENLEKHTCMGTSEKTYLCEHCFKSFSSDKDFKFHVRYQTKKAPYVCKGCKKSFNALCGLRVHEIEHRRDKLYNCVHCKEVFFLKSHLMLHTKHIHSVKRPYACYRCQISFDQLELCKAHILSHTGDRFYLCSKCPESFDTNYAFYIHINRKIMKKKPCMPDCYRYSCEHCDKTFEQLDYFKTHLSVHTGNKNFVCEYCGARFRLGHGLLTHKRIHTGVKKYSCYHCSKSFFSLDHLERHIRHIHTHERPFACNHCDKSFHTPTNLNIHLHLHSGGELKKRRRRWK